MKRLSPDEIQSGLQRVRVIFDRYSAAWPKYEAPAALPQDNQQPTARTLHDDIIEARERKRETHVKTTQGTVGPTDLRF
jgi:hypothetical protein